MSNYLRDDTRFDDKQLERHFQITPSIFEYIFWCLAMNSKYWCDGKDCTKRPKNKPEVKKLSQSSQIMQWRRDGGGGTNSCFIYSLETHIVFGLLPCHGMHWKEQQMETKKMTRKEEKKFWHGTEFTRLKILHV